MQLGQGMNVVAGVFFALHAVAHLAGFAGAFSLVPALGHPTTVLFGKVDLTQSGARAGGLGWLFAAAGFAIASAGAFADALWWPRFVIVAAIASLAMCILYLPETRVGVAVNAVILVAFLFGKAALWWIIRD